MIPRIYKDATLEDFPEKVRQVIKEATDPGRDVHGAILVGNVGTGKTHLCAAVAKTRPGTMMATAVEWINDFRSEAAGRVPRHFGRPEVKPSYNPAVYIPPPLPPTVMERAMDAPMVVIDDVGAHRATDFAEEQLYQLIDHRTANRLCLVVSTNMTAIQLSEMNPRVADRLRYLRPILLGGMSRRR
jgi:DNA replication protein DnaC